MSYIDDHIEYLGVHEGTKGASERVEDSSKSAAPYGLDNPPIPRKEKETDKAYAKRVLQYFEKEAINTLGDAYSNAPIGVKRAVLDSYYNSGRLYPGQVASLKGSDYKGFAKNTLDIVSANDPKTNSGGILKGLANRKAATYNLMAGDETGLPPITGGELINVDGNAKLIYNTGKDPYTFNFQKPLHSGSTPGALNVKTVQPQEVVKQIPAGGIQQLEQQMFKPYNFGFRKGGKVYTDTINVSPDYRIPNLLQERARRSMMHGNYQDRMEDYAYAREQARRPYVNRYPVDSRGRGAYSTAAPMRNQAARMMGFAKGGLINTQGPRPMNNLKTQAQGLAALGRGGDSTLVHMQPEEVAGLQQLAQANGTSLTINPATGMPEAFSLGNMFKAALPIAAGYITGGAATPFFGSGAIGSMLSKPLVAGALTGATVAGATGDDPIMGAVTGGFGGVSGAGLQSAMTGVPEAMRATGAATSDMGQQLAAQNAYTGSLGGMQANPTAIGTGQASTSMMTPQASMNPFQADGLSGTSAMGRGYDQLALNTGSYDFEKQVDPVTKMVTGEKQVFTPGGPLQVANRIGGPAASLALGGLEESDFYEDVDFSDPRDKYNPNSKLNLNRDTGIAAALQKDTGLRLYAEGGEVGGGVTGAGLAPGTPVAGAMMGGGMGGSMAESASETISGPGGTETFSSMVASGMHPANAAAMLGMDPSPYLDTGPGMTFTGSSAAPTPSAPASTPAFTPPPMGASSPSSAPRAPSAPSASRPPVIGRDVGLDPGRYGYRGVGEVGGMPSPVGPGITKSRFEEMIRKGYKQGGYLNTGGTIGDGMSDDIQATINNNQPAALSDGEFVVPADVVSHLGNGSSDAGAKRLYDMMDKVRKARTGTTKQGREINPEKMMPK